MNLSEASVLLVDDEPMLLEIFSHWLLGAGCAKVFTAANGEDALTILNSERIDLLLTDVRMPVMDGVALVRRLAAIGATLPSIVFVSGFGDIDQREMYALGAEAFVAKPCDRKELLAVLERAVAERSALWHTEMAAPPRQSLIVEARRLDESASLDSIGLGRGGFSVCTSETISPGKVAFRLVLAENEMEIAGQGYVRWCSRTEGKAGVEFAFLSPDCREWLTDAVVSAAPRSFIPGS